MPKGREVVPRPAVIGRELSARGSATEQLLDAAVVRAGELDLVEQPPGAPARLVLEQVVAVRAAAHDLARSGDPEALGGAAVGLGLGHVGLSIARGSVGAGTGSCGSGFGGRWCGRTCPADRTLVRCDDHGHVAAVL